MPPRPPRREEAQPLGGATADSGISHQMRGHRCFQMIPAPRPFGSSRPRYPGTSPPAQISWNQPLPLAQPKLLTHRKRVPQGMGVPATESGTVCSVAPVAGSQKMEAQAEGHRFLLPGCQGQPCFRCHWKPGCAVRPSGPSANPHPSRLAPRIPKRQPH